MYPITCPICFLVLTNLKRCGNPAHKMFSLVPDMDLCKKLANDMVFTCPIHKFKYLLIYLASELYEESSRPLVNELFGRIQDKSIVLCLLELVLTEDEEQRRQVINSATKEALRFANFELAKHLIETYPNLISKEGHLHAAVSGLEQKITDSQRLYTGRCRKHRNHLWL